MPVSKQVPMKRLNISALITVAVMGVGSSARAIEFNGGSTDLTLGSNWVGGVAPSGAVANFSSQDVGVLTGLTFGATLPSWSGIVVTNPTGPIGIVAGGTLSLGAGGIDMSAATVNLSMANLLVLGAAQTWNVGNNVVLTQSGIVSGGAGLSITKTGNGTLAMSAANTYTGGLNLNAGVFVSNAAGSLGGAANVVTLNGGTLNVISGNNTTYAQSITAGAGTVSTINMNNTSNQTFTGSFLGSGTLNVNCTSNAWTWSIDGAANQLQNFSGTINFGTSIGNVRFQAASDKNAANTTINLGTGGNSSATSLRLFNRDGSDQQIGALSGGINTTLEGPASVTATMQYAIGNLNTATTMSGRLLNGNSNNGVMGLRKVGTGTFTLNAASGSTYTGVTDIQNGVVEYDNVSNFGLAGSAATNLIVGNAANANATLRYTGASNATLNRLITLNNVATLESTGTGGISFTNTGAMVSSASTTLVLGGNGTGLSSIASSIPSGSLIKNGTGTWTLSNASNALTGTTAINGGKLIIGGNLGTAGVTVASGAILGPVMGVGTLSAGNMTLAAGSGIDFDFDIGINDVINLNSTPLNLASSVTLNLYNVGTTTAFNTNGSYQLFSNVSAINGGIGSLVVGNVASGWNFVPVGNSIYLNITGGAAPTPTWNVNNNNAIAAWGTAGNWNPSGAPDGAGQTAVFLGKLSGGVGTVTLDTGRTLGTLLFNNTAGSYLVAGNGGSLTLNNNGSTATITNAGGTHSITAPVNFVDDTTISSVGLLTLGGALTGNSFTVTGSGTTTLSGANSVASMTIGGTGVAIIAGPSSVTTTTINAGSVLQLAAGGSLGSGAVVDNGTLQLTRSDAHTIAANISGTGVLLKTGTGTATLTGTNNYAGLTTINAGKLEIAAGSTGSLAIPIEIAPGSTDNATLLVSGGVLNTSQLFVAGQNGNNGTPGTGTLVQTGGIINDANWVTVGAGNSAASTSAVGTYSLNGGTLNLLNNNSTSNFELANYAGATGMVTINGSASMININNNASLMMGNNNNAGSGTVTQNAGQVVFNRDAAGTATGGTGVLRLGNAGTLPGGAYVYNLNGGTLTVGAISRNTGAGNLSTGTFNFNGGTLKVAGTSNAAAFMSTLTAANVLAGGAIIDDNGINATVAQGLLDGGGGGFTKRGVGTLTMSGTSNYSGATTVNAGVLRITGALQGSGAVNVVSGAGIGGTGSIAGAVSIAGGGSLTLGDSAIGTLTLGNNLTLATGGGTSNLRFDVGPTADLLTVGQLTVSAGGTANFSFNDFGAVPGTYTVATFSSLNNLGTLDFTPSNAGFLTATPALSGNSIVVTITGGAVPTTAYWSGSLGTTAWNANTSGNSNFNTDATSGTNLHNIPQAGTDVIFATTNPAVSAASLLTTLGQNFAVNSIQVQAGLAGPVTIDPGAAGTLTIGSGGIGVAAGAALTISAPTVVNGAETWNGGANSGTNGLTNTGVISGTGTLTLDGFVTLGGTAANTQSGGTKIVGTVFDTRNGTNFVTSFGSSLIGAGGTITLNTAQNGTITAANIPTGQSLTFHSQLPTVLNFNLLQPVTGGGTLSIAMDGGASNLTAGNSTALAGFTGTVAVSSGYLRFTNGTSPVTDAGASTVSFNLVSGGGLRSRNGGAFVLGALSGDQTGLIAGAINTNDPANFTIGTKESSTYSGMILSGYAANVISPVNLIKVGAATTLTLAGTGTGNSYAGTVAVNAGVLEITNIANGGIVTTGASSGNTVVVTDTTGMSPGMQVVGNSISPGTTTGSTTSGAASSNPSTTISSINGTTITLSQNVSAANANTSLLIGTGNALGLSSNAPGNLTIDGGTLRYIGPAASSDRLFSVGLNSGNGTLESSGTGPVNFSNTGQLGFGATSRTLTLGGTNTGTNTLAAAIGNGASGTTSLAKTGPGKWTLSGPISASGSLAITGGTLAVTPDGASHSAVVMNLSGLTITSGKLDLQDRDMIIRNPGGNRADDGPITTLGALIHSGLTGGSGIMSSAAVAAGNTTLGFGYAGDFNISNFDGVPVAPTDMLVRYVGKGDANFDGQTDAADLDKIFSLLGGLYDGPYFGQGDLNGDGQVDAADLDTVFQDLGNLVGGGFTPLATTGTGAILGLGSLAAVPEPASLMLLGLGGATLLARRRRKA